MKRYLPIFILLLLCSSCSTQHKTLKITNGMFFYEKPEQVPPGTVVEMAMFEDSVWGKITGEDLSGCESCRQDAIYDASDE